MRRVDHDILFEIDELRKQRGLNLTEFSLAMGKERTFWSSVMYNAKNHVPGTAFRHTMETIQDALRVLNYGLFYMPLPKGEQNENNAAQT